jgi:hypothetical protein
MKLPLRWSWPYTKLETDNEADDRLQSADKCTRDDFDPLANPFEQSSPDVNRSRVFAFFIILASGLALTTIVYGVATQKTQQDTASQVPSRMCGNSSAEAISLGCTWDQLTWSWLPPDCPHYANEEFLQAEDWKFYTDPLGKQEAVGETWRNAMDNLVDLWGERREHLTHCVYLFLSLGQVIRDSTPHHQRLTGYEHVHHCSKIILEALRKGEDWHKMETFTGMVSYEESC